MGDIAGLWIGGDICAPFDLQQTPAQYSWQSSFINCIQSNLQAAGHYNLTQQLEPYGYSLNDIELKRTSFTNGAFYEYTVLPRVNSISSNQGS